LSVLPPRTLPHDADRQHGNQHGRGRVGWLRIERGRSASAASGAYQFGSAARRTALTATR